MISRNDEKRARWYFAWVGYCPHDVMVWIRTSNDDPLDQSSDVRYAILSGLDVHRMDMELARTKLSECAKCDEVSRDD